MLKKITLSHFRQHLDRTFEFGPGLNAIRGENEAGKTTVLEAFLYFCFGARAMREAMDDIVTYHQPLSKLRVDVEFEHLGVAYRGYRGTSGAELSFGREKVVGQNKVTEFFEQLFKADAKLAGRLMFASQKSLAESLKAGPTDAGKMIEELANFDLIDRVAEAITTHRPTGKTDAVEARIATLQGQLTDAAPEDLGPLREEIAELEGQVQAAQAALAGLQAERAAVDVDGARRDTNDYTVRSRNIEQLTFSIDEIDRELARPAVLAPAAQALEDARAAVEAEKQYARAAGLHAELSRTDTGMQWDQSLASLEAEAVKTDGLLQAVRGRHDAALAELARLDRERAERRRAADVEVAQLEGRLIKETTCALCQKDLSDVPEVVRTNSELGRQIADRKQALAAALEEIQTEVVQQERLRDIARTEVTEQTNYLRDLNAVITANARIEQLYARAADFIGVDRSVVPGRWRWIGPVISTERPDVVGQLRHLETLQREAEADAVRRQEKEKQRAGLVLAREGDIAARRKLDFDAAGRVLALAAALDQKITAADGVLQIQRAGLQQAKAELSTKEALAAQAARQQAATREQLEAAQAELATMQRYNLLLKKVRAARPVITNKLWNIVLGGASKHFSDVRGVESHITRADGTFRCNGFPVSGLSGSAEDMLGLALRVTLTKTFLPGIDMLQLDEPAAACSDAREARLLGLLAKLGFGQTILITHSDQADAFADRIINV